MITEKDNVFYCDCGFSFQRDRSGAHDCADGLRNKLAESEAKCAALAAENAGLKAGSGFFMYSEETGFEFHKTKTDAIKSAEDMIGVCREEACSEGWPEDTESICWGVIMQKATEADFEKPSEENGWIGWSEFSLTPSIETPATDAFLAEVRAHDLNAFIQHHSAELDAHIKNGGEQFDEKSVRIRDIIVSARLFREQIRKEAAQ